MTPVRRSSRRRDRLIGWALTLGLAVALVAAAGGLVLALGLFVVAMPLTTGAIAAVVVWAGWRLLLRRRRGGRMSPGR